MPVNILDEQTSRISLLKEVHGQEIYLKVFKLTAKVIFIWTSIIQLINVKQSKIYLANKQNNLLPLHLNGVHISILGLAHHQDCNWPGVNKKETIN